MREHEDGAGVHGGVSLVAVVDAVDALALMERDRSFAASTLDLLDTAVASGSDASRAARVCVVSADSTALHAVLDRSCDSATFQSRRFVIVGQTVDRNVLARCITAGLVMYYSPKRLALADLHALLESCRNADVPPVDSRRFETAAEPWSVAGGRIAEALTSAAIAKAAQQAIRDLVADTAAARCALFDGPAHSLDVGDSEADSAATGIAGFVACTGRASMLNAASTDARYDPEVDNPSWLTDVRVIASPAVVDGSVRAVLTATRCGTARPFSPRDLSSLSAIAEWVSAALWVHDARAAIQARTYDLAIPGAGRTYRRDALRHLMSSTDSPGQLGSVRRMVVLSLYAALGGLCFSTLGAYILLDRTTTRGLVVARAESTTRGQAYELLILVPSGTIQPGTSLTLYFADRSHKIDIEALVATWRHGHEVAFRHPSSDARPVVHAYAGLLRLSIPETVSSALGLTDGATGSATLSRTFRGTLARLLGRAHAGRPLSLGSGSRTEEPLAAIARRN